MLWKKVETINDNGEKCLAQVPVIISASRATDIPAFYSEWFLNRLKKGYIKWKNPFNNTYLYVSFQNARLIVFWSKNPKKIIQYLDEIKSYIPNLYFQFTLNDYGKEELEPNVSDLNRRIETFIELSEKIGKEKVIWRFDPLILTNQINVETLLERIENIGDQLKYYTEKLVFSYADIKVYKKVRLNLLRNSIKYQEFSISQMNEFAEKLQILNKKWNYSLATCAETIDLEKYGIQHNKCIDDDLIIKLFPYDKQLMEFLGVNPNEDLFSNSTKKKDIKDKGQREFCGCIASKDIGEYNTCPHHCVYCYANTSFDVVNKNYKIHDKHKDTITGS